MAAATVATLLRHGATNRPACRFQGSLLDLQLGRAVVPRQTFNQRSDGFSDRLFVANIDAIAHDCHPLLRVYHNA